ncbi:MAG TPA: prevent-host-death protein [Prevotella sp.]|nr:prevent-host-death protein [Prevotella sp.]
MTVATISDFRANVKRYVDDVINNSGSLLINRGNTAAVLISLDEYNSIKETEKVLSSERLSGRLETGIEELNSGKAVAVDIDEL